MSLKAIGFWVATDNNFINPIDWVGEYSSKEEKENIVKYLSQGLCILDFMGYSFCRICGDESKSMGASEQTDGVWVWPEGLIHYVSAHNVVLPKQFISHAEGNEWLVPKMSKELNYEYSYEACKST